MRSTGGDPRSSEYPKEISTSPLVSRPLLGSGLCSIDKNVNKEYPYWDRMGEDSSPRYLRTGSNHMTTRLKNGRWRTGQSGNPGGRPAGVTEIREFALRYGV